MNLNYKAIIQKGGPNFAQLLKRPVGMCRRAHKSLGLGARAIFRRGAEMRNTLIGMVVLALLQLMGIPTAHAVRIVDATETFLPEPANINFTSLTDSVVGQLCLGGPANENAAACFTNPYSVGPGLLAGSATVGVQLLDPHGSAALQGCTGSNLVGDQCVSDQLYLRTVANADGSGAVHWCWDSDLEPGSVNICQNAPGGDFSSLVPTNINELPGTMDLTSFFTAPSGPLAGGGVWQVTAASDVPEPASLLILAASLLGMGAYRRLRSSAL
jgi:hypothetical protein